MRSHLFFSAAILALLAPPSRADVTIESLSRSGGLRGMGAFESTAKRMIQGEKSREESTFKFTGKVLGFLSGGKGKEGVEIVRVDLDKVWSLDMKRKTYTERPIAAEPLPMEEKEEKGEKAPAEEKPTHKIKKMDFSVKKTGEAKEVNGFKTSEVLAAMLVEIEDLQSQEVTTYTLETRLWITPWTSELRKAQEEEAAFSKAYLAKLTSKQQGKLKDVFSKDMVRNLLGVGGPKTEEALARFEAKLREVDGYPIVTDSRWLIQEDPKAKARREAERAKEDEGEGVNLSGGVSGVAGGLLGGFMKKKVKEKAAAKEKEREGEPVLSTYHEVKGVEVVPGAKDLFEVPEGFKKKG